MFNQIGWSELILLAIVGLIVLGPERLPKAAADAARMLRQLRTMARSATADLKAELGPEMADLDLASLHPRRMMQSMLDDDAEAADARRRRGSSGLCDARRPTGAGAAPARRGPALRRGRDLTQADQRLTLLLRQLGDHQPVNDREALSLQRLRAELDRLPQPFDELADPVHVTASAAVIGPRGVPLPLHKRLGIWIQPGGHVAPGEQLLTAAVRETAEETGLAATP